MLNDRASNAGSAPTKESQKEKDPVVPSIQLDIERLFVFSQFKTPQLAPFSSKRWLWKGFRLWQSSPKSFGLSHEDSPLSSGVWQWSATKTFGVFLMKLPNLWKNRKKITGSTKRQLLLVKWHWAMKPRSHRVVSQRCRSSFKNPSRMVFSQGKLQKLSNVPQGGGDPWRQLRIESIEESHLARH